MTSQGRQYPAAPCCDLHGRNCEPPSELCCWECTEARHAGWTDDRGRQRYGHPAGEECSSPIVSPLMLDNVTASTPPLKRAPDFSVPPGEIMASLLGAPEQPGPPYVHTLVPPEPIGQDEDGNDIYPPPGPAYTLTHRPVADVVAEAGFGPVPERIEVTADFCQCPACREARCEP